MKMEASVDPQCGGPDWTPITPKTGFLFHAETQPIQEVEIHEQRLSLVKRLSMMRIMARRMKAALVLA
jgi:hypothetical protein